MIQFNIRLLETSLCAMLLFSFVAACSDSGDADDGGNADDQSVAEVDDSDDATSAVATPTEDPDDALDMDESPIELIETESDDGEQSVAALIQLQESDNEIGTDYEGTLTVNDACLGIMVEEDDFFYPIIWPAGVTVDFENGNVVVGNENGDVLARENDEISLERTYVPQDDQELIAKLAPEDCNALDYRTTTHIDGIFARTETDPAIDRDMTVYFPQWEDEDASDSGSYSGELVHEHACLQLEGGVMADPIMLIWPADWDITDDGDDVIVLDESGNELARTGDDVQLDAKFTELDAGEYGVPDDCGAVYNQYIIYDIEVEEEVDDRKPWEISESVVPDDEQRWRMERQRQLTFNEGIGQLQTEEGDRFGGVYWEDEPEFRLVVNMTDGDEAFVRELIGEPELLEILEVRTVEFSWDDLLSIAEATHGILPPDVITQMVDSLPMPIAETNTVQIRVEDASAVEDALEEAGETLPEGAEIVEVDPEELDEPEEDD